MKRKTLHDLESGRRYNLNLEEGNVDTAGPEDAVVQPFTEFLVGRSSDCNLNVPQHYREISRKHLRFFLQDGEIKAQDLNSRYGTEHIRHSFRDSSGNGRNIEQRLPSEKHPVEGTSYVSVRNGDEFLMAPDKDDQYTLVFVEE